MILSAYGDYIPMTMAPPVYVLGWGVQFAWCAKYFGISLSYKKNRVYSFEHYFICDIQNPLSLNFSHIAIH